MSSRKSVRLSELLRNQIMSSVVREFEKNFLKDMGHETATELHEAIQTERQRVADEQWDLLFVSYRTTLDLLPDWMLTRGSQLMLFQEDDSSKVFKHQTSGNRPCKTKAAEAVIPVEQWKKTFAALTVMESLHTEVEKGTRDLRSEVRPILDSVGSTKQLLEIWPSMENFLPPHIADPDSGINLPALNISRLQEKIMGEKK